MNPLLSEWLAMTPDDQNDAVAAQVDREFPLLQTLNDDELDNLREQREKRFIELVNNPERALQATPCASAAG